MGLLHHGDFDAREFLIRYRKYDNVHPPKSCFYIRLLRTAMLSVGLEHNPDCSVFQSVCGGVHVPQGQEIEFQVVQTNSSRTNQQAVTVPIQFSLETVLVSEEVQCFEMSPWIVFRDEKNNNFLVAMHDTGLVVRCWDLHLDNTEHIVSRRIVHPVVQPHKQKQ